MNNNFEGTISSINDECGVFGIFNSELDKNVSPIIYRGILSLQHRGQSSAGIAVSNKESIFYYKNLGLVFDVFKNFDLEGKLVGQLGIGHVRYPTKGSSVRENAQPIILENTKWGFISIVHNGNIVNMKDIKNSLVKENPNIEFQSTSDSEVILHLIKYSSKNTIEDAIIEVTEKIEGAFSFILMLKDKLLAIRDKNGFRPLSIGKMKDNDSYCLSSETCTFNEIGAEYIREVKINELILIDKNGLNSLKMKDRLLEKERLCLFEFIYLSRNDSNLFEKNIYSFRKSLGIHLAKKYFIQTDIIVPIPDSGTAIAIGYSQESKIPLEMGIVKSPYIGRSFIEDNQKQRNEILKYKFKFIPEIFKGKKVTLIDDSIVRGNVIKYILKSIFEIGAKEIHFMVGSPPFLNPCFYGIDTPNKEELLAHIYKNDIEAIRKSLNLNSLFYLDLETIYREFGKFKNRLCDACFTGKYPTKIYTDDNI